MGIKQLYNDNLRKLPNEYGDVSVMTVIVNVYIFWICRFFHLSELFSNSFIEKIFLKLKNYGGGGGGGNRIISKSRNYDVFDRVFPTLNLNKFVFLGMCTFYCPIVKLYSEQHSLSDARDINNQNTPISTRVQSDFYKSSVRFTAVSAFLLAVHITSFRGARWLSGRVSDSGERGPGFETYLRRVVSLSKTLYSPKVLVNYPGSDGSVPT